VRTFSGQGVGGSSDAVIRTLWRKNSAFFEIYGVSARTRGLNQCGYFGDKEGGGVNFSRFCADVFYGQHLIAYSFGIFCLFEICFVLKL